MILVLIYAGGLRKLRPVPFVLFPPSPFVNDICILFVHPKLPGAHFVVNARKLLLQFIIVAATRVAYSTVHFEIMC